MALNDRFTKLMEAYKELAKQEQNINKFTSRAIYPELYDKRAIIAMWKLQEKQTQVAHSMILHSEGREFCAHCGEEIFLDDIKEDIEYDYDEDGQYNGQGHIIKVDIFKHLGGDENFCCNGSCGPYPLFFSKTGKDQPSVAKSRLFLRKEFYSDSDSCFIKREDCNFLTKDQFDKLQPKLQELSSYMKATDKILTAPKAPKEKNNGDQYERDGKKYTKINGKEFEMCGCGRGPKILPVRQLDSSGKMVGEETLMCIPCADSLYRTRERMGLKNIVS